MHTSITTYACNMCIYVCTYTYIPTSAYIHVCIYLYIYFCMHVICAQMCIYGHTYIYAHACCLHTCMHINTCLPYALMYVCLYTYLNVYIDIAYYHTHTYMHVNIYTCHGNVGRFWWAHWGHDLSQKCNSTLNGSGPCLSDTRFDECRVTSHLAGTQATQRY